MNILRDIYYTTDERRAHSLDVHLPKASSFPTFVFFHGGGLEEGDKSHSKPFIHYLTTHGVAVVNANYRLYPEAVYPDFICDAAAAVAWACHHMPHYGGNGRVFVGGSSAGAYLSMMLCFDKRYLAVHNLRPHKLAGFIHNCGQPTTHFNVLRERGLDPRRAIIDEAAPLYHIGETPEYAPLLFLVGDNDMPGRPQQTDLVISTLDHLGYDMSKIERLIFSGTHCRLDMTADENGNNHLGLAIHDFIIRHR